MADDQRHPAEDPTMANMSAEQVIGLKFASIVLGVTPTDGPPPPGSPLARILAATSQEEQLEILREADGRRD